MQKKFFMKKKKKKEKVGWVGNLSGWLVAGLLGKVGEVIVLLFSIRRIVRHEQLTYLTDAVSFS
jgi:hypothetical protein